MVRATTGREFFCIVFFYYIITLKVHHIRGDKVISEINKKQQGKRVGAGATTLLVIGGLLCLALLIRLFLIGHNVTLFNPQGLISHQQHKLFVLITILLFAAALPVVLLLYFIAWKFRETNTKVLHRPPAKDRKGLVVAIWGYPLIFFIIFTSILLPATHKLEPRKAIAEADAEPLTVQVIAMRWKWLFLYPEQNIASVNYVQLPVNRPVKFELTADDAPMTSFWIPNLGGQLYAMTGHVNPLNLMPDKIGEFPGSTAEINGEGFADMNFKVDVTSAADFDGWLEATRSTNKTLNRNTYDELVKPSHSVSAAIYAGYEDNLYNTVIAKYMGHGAHHTQSEGHE